MKKNIQIFLIAIVLLIGLVLLDTLQAMVFNNRPFISEKEYYDRDNWIAKGILVNTYHCIDQNNALTMEYKLKNAEYMCPIKLNDFNLSILIESGSERTKMFVGNYKGVDYYFGNTYFNVFLSQNEGEFDIKTALTNDMVELNDILEKSDYKEDLSDYNSIIYRYPGYLDIIVCDNNSSKKSVIFAEAEVNLEDIEYFYK